MLMSDPSAAIPMSISSKSMLFIFLLHCLNPIVPTAVVQEMSQQEY